MPRKKRAVLPGLLHHITQRGNNRRDVFFDDGDRALYLSLLTRYSAQYGMDLLGYCLMANHIHLLARPGNASSFAKALGRTHCDYARWLHIRRRESGHLWQNRFFSCPIEPAYSWAVLAYIERNPLRAGLVEQTESWAWSSAREHVGLRHSEWLTLDLWSSSWTPTLWRAALQGGLAEADLQSRMQEATQSG
ncbi:MAG: transposase, partial [Acidobacteriaceae bacterium]|nr:transposase [Acidobacteriaceae bacterium]